MYTSRLYLSLKRINANGLAPIYAKIHLQNKYYDRSSGIYINPKDWDRNFRRVNPKCLNASTLNEQITDFENKLFRFRNEAKSIVVLDALLSGNDAEQTIRPLFLSALDSYMKQQENLIDKPEGITYTTYKTYKYKRKNFEAFFAEIDRPALHIDEFNANLGDRFKKWLYSKEFKRTHVNKHLKFAKTIIRYAKFEYGVAETNFLNVVVKYGPKNDIVSLTNEEIYKIQTHVCLSEMMQKTADLFLLQCYTGMSYCDIININTDMIQAHSGKRFIHYNRKKSGVKGIVPLHPQVMVIMKRYNMGAPKLANALYNRMLKELAAVVGIQKHLTSHVGRKTFGTLQINDGQNIEAVTKMLAKTNIKETASVYADVSHQLMLSQSFKFNQRNLFE